MIDTLFKSALYISGYSVPNKYKSNIMREMLAFANENFSKCEEDKYIINRIYKKWNNEAIPCICWDTNIDIDESDFIKAREELHAIYNDYKKINIYNKENNITAYSNTITPRIIEWVKIYRLVIKSKEEIKDLYFRIFDLSETEEIDYDLLEKDGFYKNIRKEFGLE